MSQPFTEEANLASAPESVLGTIPASGWRQHQPNTVGKFGNSVTKIARDIMSSNRQDEAGRAVDIDSGVEMQFDLTKDALDRDIEDIFKSLEKSSGNTGVGRYFPTEVTATGYTVAASGALTNNMLFFARGFTTPANNGLKQALGTSTGIEIKTTGLTAEASPPANVTVEVAGWRGAAGDITMDVNGNLTSTLANFTQMGLNVGQWVWVGGPAGSAFAFANAAYRGWARIKTIAAALLTLELRSWVPGAADDGATKTIDIYFGSFIRVVGSLHADFRKPSRTCEVAMPKLGAADATEFFYARGNMINTYALSLTPGSKVTVNAMLVGTVTNEPTVTQATGASTPFVPTGGTIGMITTSSDLSRLRINNVDETGLATAFKDMTININHNVTADKQLAVEGASKLNVGKSQWSIDTTIMIVDSNVIKAVRSNILPSLTTAFRNDDGAAMLDCPACQVDDTPLELARQESVRVKAKLTPVRHPTLNYVASMSRLPYCPVA